MRHIYFDCFSGISGDMVIGSLLDAGLKLEELREGLSLLPLKGYELRAEKTMRRHLSATSFFVDVKDSRPQERGLQHIMELLEKSTLPEKTREKAQSIFTLLADTEAAIHSTTPDKIRFHEVGAVDSIIDVVGALIGLDRLGIDEVHSSPVNVGRGFVECKHGILPVPAPATLKLLEGISIYSHGPEAELVTPTGAVLLRSLARSFGPLPPQRIVSQGYGAGKGDFPEWPNLLRAVIGEPTEAFAADDVVVMSTTIDDMNPENFEYLMELLFEGGALEVYLTPIHTKKTRPGTLLTLLCDPSCTSALAAIVFSESTTFGVRYHREARLKLTRKIIEVSTEWGAVRVKVGTGGGRVMSVSPEFEDCKTVARRHKVPLKRVYDAARDAAMEELEE
ncbi:MAG: nickel pincer cofactor biosynthesis protein LarC [Candidatus Hydrogenedentota bacterium]|nr:MAG: nickel pincer cofactor biosynthesis protein LarC [Candidatus Hydrogenedentota bacterium]